jgi:hypothetical protein
MNAYELLELLEAHIADCEDAGTEAELVIVTQPNYPMLGKIAGVKTDDNRFVIGIQDCTEGYATSNETDDLDGF